ncbi:alpha beta-hydrolase [Phaeosphaeria sp. MPI-PUGE-AT-0046c]|nr:alpha beta-hydrolase [Phaeosphaeria sp. MPI-PUGE-AT-0046c]
MSASISQVTVPWKSDPSAGEIPAHIHYSTSTTQDARPIALIFHAGGFVLGSSAMVPQSQISYLAARGFVVVVPEYRLCPQVTVLEGPVQDAKDVLRWCQESLSSVMSSKDVQVDPNRVVAMGHSAGGMLALVTGLAPSPPLAIIDFYGLKNLSDPSLFKPLPAFAQLPDSPADFIAKIFEGPQALTSLPMFVDGKPNLADPRCAWYLRQIKQGTALSSIMPDADIKAADPASQFTNRFPPTYFLHGKVDSFVKYELTVQAHAELEKLGVETELVLPENLEHAFDLQPQVEQDVFEKYVVPALEFLIRHV